MYELSPFWLGNDSVTYFLTNIKGIVAASRTAPVTRPPPSIHCLLQSNTMSSDYEYSDEDVDYYDDEEMMDTQEDGQRAVRNTDFRLT